jgi:hypothetical protein
LIFSVNDNFGEVFTVDVIQDDSAAALSLPINFKTVHTSRVFKHRNNFGFRFVSIFNIGLGSDEFLADKDFAGGFILNFPSSSTSSDSKRFLIYVLKSSDVVRMSSSLPFLFEKQWDLGK